MAKIARQQNYRRIRFILGGVKNSKIKFAFYSFYDLNPMRRRYAWRADDRPNAGFSVAESVAVRL